MNYFFPIIIVSALVLIFFKKARRFSTIILLFIFLALLIIYPKESIEATKEGINLWIFVVMPSLFPFFIISDLLISLKIPENIARLFTPTAKFLFNTSGYGAYVFIMSIFTGYPSGAKITSDLIRENKITPMEGQKILTFSSTSGPLFIIGTVGAGMLGSRESGYIIFICHILGSIINGILFKFISRNSFYDSAITDNPHISNKKLKIDNPVSDAIINSLYSSGLIGGYIILFSVIIKLLDKINIYSAITNTLKTFLPDKISSFPEILLKTSLEISNGCKIISTLPYNFEFKIILASFIIAFSGFSVIGQVSSIIGKTNINIKVYVLGKLSHGIISSLLCYLLLNTNLFKITASSPMYISLVNYNILLLQLLLLLMLILNTVSVIKRKIYNH